MSSEPPTSYTKMSPSALDSRGTDASLIGSHCQYGPCSQLDFLPFKCESCLSVFCAEHRTEDGHDCPNRGAWARARRDAELAKVSLGQHRRMRDEVATKKKCADDACKTYIGSSLVTGVHCSTCNRDYCLPHRLPEDHDCKNKIPIGARLPSASTTAVVDGAKNAFERLKLWGASKKEQAKQSMPPMPKRKPSTAASRLAAVNTLKRNAKGDAKVPPEKRVYLFIEAEARTAQAKIPKGEFFYSKDWVVGKMLDAAAKSLQVENINNQTENEQNRLRVFHIEGGRMLEFNEKLGTVLANGNTVVLLRGVGPPPDLIDF